MAKAPALAETPEAPAEPKNGTVSELPKPEPDPNDQVVEIAFRGAVFTVPKRRGRWDIDALVDFQDGKPLPGLRKLLGASQWQKVKRICPLGDDLDEFSSAAADAINANCVA